MRNYSLFLEPTLAMFASHIATYSYIKLVSCQLSNFNKFTFQGFFDLAAFDVTAIS